MQARLAIEAFKALLGVLEQVRPAGEVAGHRGVLSQLQLAYAGAVTAGASRVEPEEGQAPVVSEAAPVVTEAAQAADAEEPATEQAIDADEPAGTRLRPTTGSRPTLRLRPKLPVPSRASRGAALRQDRDTRYVKTRAVRRAAVVP